MIRRLLSLCALLLAVVLVPAVAQSTAGLMSVDVKRIERLKGYQVERSYWGRVKSRREVRSGFRIAGRVEALHLNLGDRFEAGQVLAELAAGQARAQVEVARAQLEVADQNLALAEQSRDRQQKIKRYATPETLETATRTVKIRQAQVQAAERQLQQAKEQLGDHFLLAPWSGMVQQRMLDEGAVVKAGTALFHLIEDGPLEIQVGLSSALAASLEEAGDARHRLHLGDEQVEVTLSRLAPATSATSRTRQAVFKLPRGMGRAGQGGELRLGVRFEQPGYWVPMQSLSQLRKGLWSLMVLDDVDGGNASIGQRIVEILHVQGDRVYVDGAVSSGEWVVVSGAAELVAGQRVRFDPAAARQSARWPVPSN